MNTFYDIHTYVFNLNHPNLSEFLLREDLIDSLIDKEFNFGVRLQLLGASFAFKNFIKKKINEIYQKAKKEVDDRMLTKSRT